MNRPPCEVADVVREYGKQFVQAYGRLLDLIHLRVLYAIGNCRTAVLGGHIEECDQCRHRVISYNSCLNRHCPKCQGAAREKWLANRTADLLPVPYFHVVFTLPQLLAPLALQNKRVVYGILFRAASETLLEVAANPKHLGAETGFSQYFTLGDRTYSTIPICTAWCRAVVYRRIIPSGFPRAATSCYR
jgi:hypothetical protein